MVAVREKYETADTVVIIGGSIGPRDDGYKPEQLMNSDQAEAYHSLQVNAFAASAVDMVDAVTMSYVEEAVGIARACKKAGIPSVISFTLETDGKLQNGVTLGEAIE